MYYCTQPVFSGGCGWGMWGWGKEIYPPENGCPNPFLEDRGLVIPQRRKSTGCLRGKPSKLSRQSSDPDCGIIQFTNIPLWVTTCWII